MFSPEQIQCITQEGKRNLGRLLGVLDASAPYIQANTYGLIFFGIEKMVTVLTNAESPIEQLLGVHLVDIFANAEISGHPRWYVQVDQQAEICINQNNYRVDFLVWSEIPLHNNRINVVVECDGHDYHERTKEQAARDKARDRQMQTAGYHVLRFTGSEIWANPNFCAHEVVKFLRSQIEREPDDD